MQPAPDTQALVQRIRPKYRPIWERFPADAQAHLALYYLPHRSSKELIEPTRPRVIKLYCPFAHQSEFPSGHRYCVNVYTGCAHACNYCYAAAYEPECAGAKRDFEKLVTRDLEDLERFDVPPAPLHLSNSTDPFQPLERTCGHTRYALEHALQHRHRFRTITILTKNPLLPVQLGYIELFQKLVALGPSHPCRAEFERNGRPGFVMAVSLAFWREEARAFFDPGAPTVAERVAGIRALRDAGIPLVLRIDPLLPRSPLPGRGDQSLGDFGLPETQTLADLESLVGLARDLHVEHVVFSTTKIVQPRKRKLSAAMQALRSVYQTLAHPQKLEFRGGSWRLPPQLMNDHVQRPLLDLCRKYGVAAKHCRQDLLQTP